jgi:hypothetical protein
MSCYGQDKGVCLNLANAWRASPALILDWLGISMDKKFHKNDLHVRQNHAYALCVEKISNLHYTVFPNSETNHT